MKLKCICKSIVCYLTLVAFIGIVSFEASSFVHSKQKTEVSATSKNSKADFSFLFEEDEDVDELSHFIGLVTIVPNYNALFDFYAIDRTLAGSKNYINKQVIRKTPLFVSYCVFRI